MSSKKPSLMILLAVLLLGGCAAPGPDYAFPTPPISPRWHGAHPLARL